MNDEEWEKFSVEVLRQVGFRPYTLPEYGTDGGKDYIVQYNGKKYLVSCKHYINSGKHVGQDDEQNICDRLLQFDATGFIGFYSTGITTGLQNRLDGICSNGHYSYSIFEPSHITNIMQSMDCKVLQSFGLYPYKYYLNVSESEYRPLRCNCCGKDILTDDNIPYSLVGLAKCKNGAFLEIEQALHVSWLQAWENTVDEWIEEDQLDLCDDFYKMRYHFLQGVRQRQLPQTDGTWYGLTP